MCLRRDKQGISNVIVVMLSLVIVVIIFSNVILTSYQMNQFDWDRMQENVEITNVEGTTITLYNRGSVTVHIVSLWVDSLTIHQRYDMDLFINAGDSTNYTCSDINANTSIVKVITERGTMSVFRVS
jgi:Na+-transporting NADH:ubiquinone oxidoreductase subunit NqrC